MSEMTDYEINKRLAEIAGAPVEPQVYDDVGRFLQIPFTHGDVWSPLTDWSQLGPMMERERVGVQPEASGAYFEAWSTRNVNRCADPGLKRAIALAIIAAHEEP